MLSSAVSNLINELAENESGAQGGPSDPDKIASLEAAFAFFNETSAQLTNSYQFLEKKIGELTRELDQVSAEKEEQFQAKEQIATRMQALLDFLPGGVIVLDHQGYIVESNPAARELLDDSLDGQLWRHVIGRCFAPRNDDGLEVSTRTGKRISIATSSMEEAGQIILLTDQTETRKLQQNLSRYERLSAMGKMVSALAHQIRTPLSAAILYAGHLCDASVPGERKTEFSKKLYGRLQHMERQIRDMMLFVKSELPLNDLISCADLELGLREAMEVPLMTGKSQCEWHNAVPNRMFRCHREALISALMNLVNNAVQAGGEGTQLVIKLFADTVDATNYLALEIADNGPGMNEELLASAQELFVTTKAHGTGLGLAVVQSVVRAHAGKFQLDSRVGQGTVARVRIPMADKH